ncbi:hypothetical protein JAAARDRAFT_122793 [Jaapia argillacea MUCL 33604]|uniref:Xylulose kinase n=1 Tax=Jaapia argillacea MUCL 33604 TaxID=933084 RepID=A0A067QD85_9AGAM|nr:hypothetical protein JAAARDRAFT_122793 [Jaapia argillacea MUCL 33604]
MSFGDVTPAGPLFLGLDLSTQSLKGILIAEDSSVVTEHSVQFDKDLPRFGTTNGAISGPAEGEVTSPVEMWLEAIDLLMERMKAAGIDLSGVCAISGSGQQHGSVFWSKDAESLLSSMDPSQSMTSQLSPKAFSIQRSPIWQDSSTTKECRELEEAIGGPQALADLTGSRAYERFTGNQILRIRRLFPEAYAATSRISLVSSFIPSVFLGAIAPIEVSDASGMNLMDVLTCKWDDKLLEICGGPELRVKLGPEPAPGGSILGKIGGWWVKRWGFNPECIIAPFTGDNPATVVALSTPGDAILSLGTSTTLLLSIPPSDTPPARFTTSHLLSHPTTPGAQIAMLCYKNGALAREQVRDQYVGKDWGKYNECVESTQPGSGGIMGLYFPLPEIIPPGVQGDFFFRLPTSPSSPPSPLSPSSIPKELHPRLILESQFLSIKSRISAILPPHSPPLHRLVLTGGGSANQTIRQLAAEVFGMNVYVPESKEAAAIGGGVLGRFAWWRRERQGEGTFEEMVAGMVEGVRKVAEPKGDGSVYEGLVEGYRKCEEMVVRACDA